MNSFSERLSHAIKGESEHSFAKRAGISGTVLRKYISGDSLPGLDNLVKISDTLGVSVEWLATGARSVSTNTFRDAEQAPLQRGESNFTQIPVMNVLASAGHGSSPSETERVVGHIGVDPNFMAAVYTTYKVTLRDLFSLPSFGDSMEPTIKPGEYLIGSRAEHHTRLGDGIYVIRLEGDILVKRLQRLPGNKLRVSSDNEAHYTPFEINLADDALDFAILGKVILAHSLRQL